MAPESRRWARSNLTVRYTLAQTWFDLGQYVCGNKELGEFFQMPIHKSLREKCVALVARCRLCVSLFKECIELADEWLLKFPRSIWILRPRAEALVDGFVIGHMKFFESIVKNPEQREVSDFCFLATLKNWMGYTDEALDILSEASMHFPPAWDVSFHQANILLTSGDAAAAMPFAREAARKGRWHASFWELPAAGCHALSKFDEATASKQKAIDIEAEREKLKQAFVR